MDLKRLTYFVAVVENGTVTSAAQKLNMSQPPLTAQIHLLEESVGCPLFERTGRRLHLTEAGHRLYSRAKIILDLCEDTENELTDYRDGVRGILRIGVVSSLCDNIFLDWLYAFSKLHEHVQYELHEANTYALIEKIQNHLIDLAIVRTPFAAHGLTALSLGREPMLAVGDKRYMPSHSHATISLSELSHTPLILYRRWEKILRGLWEQQGITPQIFCVNDNAPTTLAMAQKGFGVSLLPASAVKDLPSDFVAKPLLEPELYSEILLIYRSYQDLSKLGKSLLSFLETQTNPNTIDK